MTSTLLIIIFSPLIIGRIPVVVCVENELIDRGVSQNLL
jgi:citrate lyase alpha subunit